MATIGNLFKDLLTASGLNPSDEKFKPIIALDTEVEDVTANLMKSNLMNVEAAKNNPELKKYYHAQALNAVDTELNERIAEYDGFTDADKALFEGERSTYKRVGLVNKRMREIEREKAQGAGGDDKDVAKFKQSIKDLEAKLQAEADKQKQIEADRDKAVNEAKAAAEASILDYAINAELGGKNYVNDKLDKSVNVTVARTLLDKKLQEVGAMAVRDENGNVKLVHRDNPEQSYMPQNQEVVFSSFVDETLGASNMLKVTDADHQGGDGGGNTDFNHIDPDKDKGGAQVPQEAVDFYDQQLADNPLE